MIDVPEQDITISGDVDWFGEQLLLNPDGSVADLSGLEFQLQIVDKYGALIGLGSAEVDGVTTNKLLYQITAAVAGSMRRGSVQRYGLLMRPTDQSWTALVQVGKINKKNWSQQWQST